jgi:hypothetical protein
MGLHGSGLMPILVLVAVALGAGIYVLRQWLRGRSTGNEPDNQGKGS